MATDGTDRRLAGLSPGEAGRDRRRPGRAAQQTPARGTEPSPLEVEPRLPATLASLRDDLGYETASLFVRGPGGWKLLRREGPERPWHVVLDPSVLEGTPEAAEYPDVRSLPGAGRRLRGLGCASMASLPLPDGTRVLLDSSRPVEVRGWIERARPYLELVRIMAGPALSSLASHQEAAALARLFDVCQAELGREGSSVEDLLAAAAGALGTDELFLLTEAGPHLEVVAYPGGGRWPQRIPAGPLEDPTETGPDLPEQAVRSLVVALGASSRAVVGAVGREAPSREVVVAGWAEGPALSPVTVAVAARTLCTVRAALEGRGRAVSRLVGRERTRLAYAIHDGLTQAVAGAVLELEAMAGKIQRDPAQALATLDAAKAEIRRSLAELRGMLFQLQEGGEEEAEAAEPLTRYVQDVVRRWRLPARVAVEGDLSRIPARVLSVAYVVIREALANAAKHAGGSTVTVSLSAGPERLSVTVGDTGRGFTPEEERAAREAHHIGLDMLRRRVAEVGGTLRVHSQPGRGTRVIAQLPIREEAR